jgi:hypothetical protein
MEVTPFYGRRTSLKLPTDIRDGLVSILRARLAGQEVRGMAYTAGHYLEIVGDVVNVEYTGLTMMDLNYTAASFPTREAFLTATTDAELVEVFANDIIEYLVMGPADAVHLLEMEDLANFILGAGGAGPCRVAARACLEKMNLYYDNEAIRKRYLNPAILRRAERSYTEINV